MTVSAHGSSLNCTQALRVLNQQGKLNTRPHVAFGVRRFLAAFYFYWFPLGLCKPSFT